MKGQTAAHVLKIYTKVGRIAQTAVKMVILFKKRSAWRVAMAAKAATRPLALSALIQLYQRHQVFIMAANATLGFILTVMAIAQNVLQKDSIFKAITAINAEHYVNLAI